MTFHESAALKTLGPCEVWDRDKLSLPNVLVEDPWGWDDNFTKRRYHLPNELNPILSHFYAGTFSSAIRYLKDNGCKVTYTAAAHDIEVSKREHEKLGIPFSYPHLTDPELWKRYVQGYLDADIVICPSKHSAACMESYGCKNIKIIPHGIDLPNEPPKPLPKQFTVGYLGSCSAPDKGVVYLLQAWKKLSYSDAMLLLAGHDSTSPFVQQLVREHGGGCIALMGWQRFTGDFYNRLSCYVQPSACLLPGSLVFTGRGQKSIDNLSEDDWVLTDSGRFRKVIKPLRRSYSGNLVSIKTVGFGVSVPMTPNHRVLAIRRGLRARKQYFEDRKVVCEKALSLREEGLGSRKISRIIDIHPQTIEQWFRGTKPHDGHSGLLCSVPEDAQSKKPEWIAAGDLEKGDVVLFPRIKKIVDIDSVKLPQKIRGVSGNSTKPLPKIIELDRDVLHFFGYYISEGCATHGLSDVIFCFHRKELEYMKEVEKVLLRLGLRPRIRFSDNKDSATVSVCSSLLGKFLVKNFGQGAHNKTIPSWVLFLPENKLASVVRGAWRGDGTIWGIKDLGRRSTSYSTVSQSLAYQMFAALVRLGFMPKINFNGSRKSYSVSVNGDDVEPFMSRVMEIEVNLGKGKTGRKTYIDDNYYYMPISEVSRIAYQGEVFNLEVEDRHCYCAPFVVHNSEGWGLEVVEAMAHGRPVLCSDGAGAADVFYGNPGYGGRVYVSTDVDELADKIDYAKKEWPLTSIGEQARSEAMKYTWPIIRQRYVEVWKELL